MQKFKSIDLFAGIGGIRLGFDQVFGDQIKTVFTSEMDKHSQKTYAANFKDDFEIAGDITKIDENEVPEFDICRGCCTYGLNVPLRFWGKRIKKDLDAIVTKIENAVAARSTEIMG